METVRPILCCPSPLHINRRPTTIVVVVNLVAITKLTFKDLKIIKVFGHQLPG